MHAAGVPVGVATCWEVIFDRAPRNRCRNGAQLLAVPANNATFNQTMSEQQLAFAKLRAVEHDRYVVVAGTTRDQRGDRPRRPRAGPHRLLRSPPTWTCQVRLKTALTPATRWGPLVQWRWSWPPWR